jgi:hypothetical protein
MGKKIIRTTKSDGTVEETVVTTRGFGHYIWICLATIFVIAEFVNHWWLVLVVGGIIILGLWGKALEKK